jgi:hypothetical protein
MATLLFVNADGFAKSSTSGLRCILRHCDVL